MNFAILFQRRNELWLVNFSRKKCCPCEWVRFLANRPAELPYHLKDLYERSVTGLTAEVAGQLFDLLLEFSDVFSEGSHDLGRTGLVQNTDGVLPIRQSPRRLPLAKEKKLSKQVRRCQSKE